MKCKKEFDGRKLPREAKAQLRLAAVKRIENGESPEAVASGMGFNRRAVYRWLEAYHYGGEDGLKPKPIRGAPPKLDAKQLFRLSRIIRTKNPLQLSFPYALWTLAMIRELIRREFNVSLSEVSVGRLMRRLGFSPQRPMYRAWQQDPTLVEAWRTTEYPKIAARAKREKALVFFADESGIRSDYHAGTTWAPVGQTPLVKATGARFGCNMLSAVNALGHFRFMTVEGRVNGTVFREFLRRLITGMDRKIFLIVDGHPSHKAKLVTKFVAENSERIELFFLPPYSPELNPDELAWAHIKSKVAKATVQTKHDLKKQVERAMRQLQKLPSIVAGFFRTPTCAYAAA
ncbi:IS630 family transposase [Aeromonas caviae]|jgi:transposase|uniref:IS630 family transposase n=1 Tax=Aeromonas caviae TaxID=648 RepID=UPI00244D3D53|nr:IS630 family transposase [Aeromonas caviae]MDH0318817.1 IS630 family transposase [Aeromonas caviae]